MSRIFPAANKVLLHYISWWLLWAMLQTIVLHRLNVGWIPALTDALITNIIFAIGGSIIFNTNRFYSPGLTNYTYSTAYVLVLTVLSMWITRWLLTFLFYTDSSYMHIVDASMPFRFMFSLLMITCLAVVSGLRYYMKQQAEHLKRKDEAKLLLRNAELSRLRQQLQPHFLFNSLNSISALAGSQPQQARKMIQQLSDFLRGTLKIDEHQLVPLEDELQHLQLYLDIEKVRFGHRLQTDLNYDDSLKALKIPSLLLQPVVENAIKFGLYDITGDVTISISAVAEGDQLVVTVENPFDPATSIKPGIGFGLSSVQKRLYLLYARNDLLTAIPEGNNFITTLRIPQV